MDRVYATIAAGSVEYHPDEAAVSIDDMIADLKSVQRAGATHVVGLSGNYRGAQYVTLGIVELMDDSDGDD